MPARLAFISTMQGEPWGGSEELWSQAAMRLVAEGHRVAVRTKQWGTEAPAVGTLRTMGAQIVYHDETVKAGIFGRIVGRLSLIRPHAWLDRFRPDLAVISQGAN